MAASEPARAMRALVGEFARRYPAEAAQAIERLPAQTAAAQLQGLPSSQAAHVVERLTPEAAAQIVAQMQDAPARRLLHALDPSRAVSLLAWLDAGARERLLLLLEARVARELRELAAYPDDSAGRLMDPRVKTVHTEATVREALARLRARGRHAMAELFVVDDEGRLAGSVAVQDAAVAPLSEPVGRLARPATSVFALATRADVVERLAGGSGGLPVVDVNDRLVGVIRPATMVSMAQDDAAADMQAMVGASREERVFSRVGFAVRKRLPWLHINLATAFLAAAVVGLFEATIAQFTALAVLLPVVAGQSGNTGAQALAVTMRGLALREARPRHWLQIAFKEGRVAFINGCAIAVTTAAGVWFWSGSEGLAGVIGLAMVASMLIAGVAGAVIPILLTVSGHDPAQASSIILTTVTDVVGFLSFLGLAALMAGAL